MFWRFRRTIPEVSISDVTPSHVVFATFNFKSEEFRREFENMLASEDGLKKTRSFKGCRLIECLRDNSKNTIVIRQEWDSQEDHEAYFQTRKDSGMLDKVSEMIDGELEISRFSPTSL